MTNSVSRASTPLALGATTWKSVVVAAWKETGEDNIGLIASGVAFYGFLALVPLLGAIVLSYGIIASPATVIHNMTALTAVMPGDAAKLVGEQLMNVVHTSGSKKGLGLFVALAFALFGARSGAGAVITALNVAFEEKETRSFVRVNLLALAITAVAVGIAILALAAVAVLGYLRSLLPDAPAALIALGKIGSYILLTLVSAAGAATLYRYGPARPEARWVWLTPGSALAAVLWLVLTIGFGIYVANFGNYNATYGSLGAVVVLLTWLYLSSYILLFGAELNAELELRRKNKPAAEVASAAAAKDAPPSPRREVVETYVAGRTVAKLARTFGAPKVGMLGSATATLGLTLLRREGRARPGLALLAAAGGLAWLTRTRKAAPGKIQAVLFDIDGTLVDSNDFHVEAWDEAFRASGHIVSREAIRGQIGKGGDLLVPALLPEIGKSDQKALTDAHGTIFQSRFLHKVRVFPGASALIRHAHGRGQRVVLASSASRAEVGHYAQLLGVTDILDASTSIDDVAKSKPEGDIFAAALAKLGSVRPEQAIVIGDTPYDIEAARKCGIATIAVRSGGFAEAALHDAGALITYDDVVAVLAGYDRSVLGR